MIKFRNSSIVVFVLLFSLPIFAQKIREPKISEYLQLLPQQFKTYSGDFQIKPSEENTLIDEKNGYAAYFSQAISAGNAYPIFEMALFRKKSGETIVVVSNLISDPVCDEHQTFFLRLNGADWIDVRPDVMPHLELSMFFESPKTADELRAIQEKIGNSTEIDLHFSLPREGNIIPVDLEICDYVPDEFASEISFQQFLDKKQRISLVWDKEKGVFNFK